MTPEAERSELISKLRDDLGFRRIAQGKARLENAWPFIETIGPEERYSGVLLGLVAQWVDAGFGNHCLVRRLLDRFPPALRPELPVLDYLNLRMAEGFLAMTDEDYSRAAAHFRFVESLGDEIHEPALIAIANFWTGRCLRKAGHYDDALSYTVRAEALALDCGYLPMAAITQITESWLAFQKGRLSDALDLLRRAEAALRETDDHMNRGNVQSAYGRIAQRQGRYDQALEHFDRAALEYRHDGGKQPQLARTLLNVTFVKRMIALQAQKILEAALGSHRHGADPVAGDGGVRERRRRIEQIRHEAEGHLREAAAIYTSVHNHRGMAGALINSGLLHFDAGDLDRAESEAAEAFGHGEEKRDFITMARARILQCMVACARSDELIGDPLRHHAAAAALAKDAVDYAGQTQNRRLQARAQVWQGRVFATDLFSDPESARRCCEQAMALLRPEGGERDPAWDDLTVLKSKVLNANPVDPQLRAWSAGIVGDKTFQQVTEEFARIVIPKVWERHGCKVSRVADALSVSPKKVRRVLQAAGLKQR